MQKIITMATGISINIHLPKSDLAFIKKLAKRMSWSIVEENKDNLFDPETGMYLNDSTMKAIRDAEAGKVKRCKKLDELIATI